MSTEVPGTPGEQKDVLAEQPAEQPQVTQADPSKDEINMGMLAHLLGFLYIVGPLIIWLMKKDESKYVEEQAREALNFQIAIALGLMAGGILYGMFAIGIVIGGLGRGAFLIVSLVLVAIWALLVVNLVFVIIASIEASKGIRYKYPVNLRLIK